MIDKSGPRRPIDKLRESAGSFEISPPDDQSPISGVIAGGGRLLLVKGKGIYEMVMADKIDPARTNIAMPNTIQKVIPYGIETPWIGAVVLTGYRLLKGHGSATNVDGDEAFVQLLKIVDDIAGGYQLHEAFLQACEEATANLKLQIGKSNAFHMPTVSNVPQRCNELLQRADHALQGLFRLVKMFYPEVGPGGWEGFKQLLESEPDVGDNFVQFMQSAVPTLQLIRNARNCAEHPTSEKRLDIKNYSVNLKNELQPPMIQVVHPKTPSPELSVAQFFQDVLQSVVNLVEAMQAYLCGRHVKPFAGKHLYVIEYPPDKRRSPHERFSYGMEFNGQFIPFG